jgi:glucose 1-dehydrogenase
MAGKTLQGQVALVTGAAEGIGKEIARRLCAAGAQVALNDADTARARAAARAVQKGGETCLPLGGDVSDSEVAASLLAETVKAFGRIDIAVANAGLTVYGDFFDYTVKDFDRLMGVNLRGSFFLAQAAARQMRSQGGGGRILLLSSVTARRAVRFLAAYGMSKAGVEGLARALVPELSPHGIAINALVAGATVTRRNLADDPDYESAWSRVTPLGRPASMDDIANAALFLVSPGAGHITGQSLVVDGGWTSIGAAPRVPRDERQKRN